MAHSRVTVSLPVEVADDLDNLSSLLGISRSGIVSVLLADRLRGVNHVLMNHVAGSLGGNTTDSPQLLRLRGKPAKHIRTVLADLVHQSTFVDPDQFELASYRDGGDDA
jgi:hypothetical protein